MEFRRISYVIFGPLSINDYIVLQYISISIYVNLLLIQDELIYFGIFLDILLDICLVVCICRYLFCYLLKGHLG